MGQSTYKTVTAELLIDTTQLVYITRSVADSYHGSHQLMLCTGDKNVGCRWKNTYYSITVVILK